MVVIVVKSVLLSAALFLLAWILNTVDYILWLLQKAISLKENPLDLVLPYDPKKKKSIQVKDAEVEKETGDIGVFRSANYKEGKELASTPYPGVYTVADLFDYLCKMFPKKPLFGSRKIMNLVEEKVETYDNNVKKISTWKIPQFGPMVWQSYEEVQKRVENIAKGIAAFTGLRESGDKFAIYHETCQEWMMTAQACFKRGLTVVTVYSTLGKEAVAIALGQSEVTSILVNEDDLLSVNENEEPRALYVLQNCPKLTHVICKPKFPHEPEKIQKQLIEPLNAYRKEKGHPTMKYITIDELEDMGSKISDSDAQYKIKRRPQKDDLAFIMYTSGTTGIPKGVMLTHANIVASTTGLSIAIDFHPKNDEFVYLGYLPLAHIMEMACELFFMMKGGCIGYGSSKTLFDKGAKPFGDLQAVRPTLFAGVPRVYDTLKKTIVTTVNDPSKTSKLKKWMFDTAFAAKKKAIRSGRETPFWNALVFKKFGIMLGGRLQTLLAGGAPTTPATQDFLRVLIGSSVVQGYGLTETGACGGLQASSDSYSTGNNGGVVPSVEIKLASVPEMNYNATEMRGEICLRGPCVTQGYYKSPKENAEAFKNGWFHTGDIGQINADGSISIIDRKKNIVKLQHGEYVALEKLEAVYCNSRFVAPSSCMCYGDPFHNQIVALVLPDQVYLKQWCLENKIISDEKEFSLKTICKNEKVRNAVYKDLIKQAENYSLCRIEYLKGVALISDEWTPNNYLTASLKLKRSAVVKDYRATLDELYNE